MNCFCRGCDCKYCRYFMYTIALYIYIYLLNSSFGWGLLGYSGLQYKKVGSHSFNITLYEDLSSACKISLVFSFSCSQKWLVFTVRQANLQMVKLWSREATLVHNEYEVTGLSGLMKIIISVRASNCFANVWISWFTSGANFTCAKF